MAAPSGGGACEEARRLARLSELVRAITTGAVSEEANLAGRERFLASLGRRPRCPNGIPVALGSVGAIAAGAAAVSLVVPVPLPGSAGEAAPGNGYVSGWPRANPVHFSSGSSVEFAAGSRGRVGDLRGTRARVVLEGGRATVHSVMRSRQGVLVEAGPYALEGGGAAFDVSWSGSVLEVRVASGAVMVEGPVVRQGLTLHEDQAFVAHEIDGESQCF